MAFFRVFRELRQAFSDIRETVASARGLRYLFCQQREEPGPVRHRLGTQRLYHRSREMARQKSPNVNRRNGSRRRIIRVQNRRIMSMKHVLSGLDRIDSVLPLLKEGRVGLMTNPTGIDRKLRSGIDILREKCCLSALYAVEHGIRGDIQAGEKVDTFTDSQTGLTVYSAYGQGSRFTDAMLEAFDILVFDIQDVGARFYTYLYSLSRAMETCARAGKRLIVLDRINPLGGLKRCGTIIDPELASFVGDFGLPTRYGLTIGEYALYVKDLLGLSLDLTVVPMDGWRRELLLDDTDLPWVAPSPNCPDLAAALAYIGTCPFEGTNISEGRGTTQPFRLIGAPFLDGNRLADRMNALGLPGVGFRACCFTPTFSKHAGALCRGVQLHILNRDEADPFAAGLLLLETIRDMAPDAFQVLPPASDGKYHLDRILGTDAFRKGSMSAMEIVEAHRKGVEEFGKKTRQFLLYD